MTGVTVIGCGLIARKRVAALPKSFQLVSVYDIDHSRAVALAESVAQSVHVATAPNEAIRSGAELVIIATYHRDLVPLSLVAVRAGCHVLVEKPGGISGNDLRQLQQEAAANNRHVRVGYNHRFHPSVKRAKDLITNGGYGKVLNVRARYGHGGRPGYDKEWRSDAALSGGGELFDQGVHLIDLVRYFTGDVQLVFAETRTDFWNCPVEDNAFLALRPQSGGFAWLHASWTEWKNLFSFEIALERAKIEISGLGGSYGTEKLTLYEMLPTMGPPETTSWEWPFPDTSWDYEMRDVAGGLSGKSMTGAGIDDAVAVLSVVDDAYAFARSKVAKSGVHV